MLNHLLQEATFEVPDYETPPQLPVTILDFERRKGLFNMMLPMADPCPACGAFNMLVGDWVCWGACNICAIGAD